jgi:GNAT superfamily N-acetyltransferase
MTSSPATSPEPPPDVAIGDYLPTDSEEAVALERLCAQGEGYRLSFRRESFHRRAENFAVHKLFTARRRGRLVGVSAIAVKAAELFGRPVQAAFGFDLRVHPELRGQGLAPCLFAAALRWGLARADLAYTYVMAGNAAAARLALRFGIEVGGYTYLVLPVLHRREARLRPANASTQEVHAEMRRVAGPFDFYADPLGEGRAPGHVASWLLRIPSGLAGCSAWDNRAILAEVVESLPVPFRLARHVLAAWPLRRWSWPRIPEPGEELRSWYLFDVFATGAEPARELLRAVNAAAAEAGIDWLYLAHGTGESWVGALRAEVPRPFAPLVPYRLIMTCRDAPPPRIGRLYVDIRDL